MAVNKIGGDYETSEDFALHAKIGVLRGPTWNSDWIKPRGGLFLDLDGSHRGVACISKALGQACTGRWKNCDQVRAREGGRGASEVQRRPKRDSGNSGRDVDYGDAGDRRVAEGTRVE